MLYFVFLSILFVVLIFVDWISDRFQCINRRKACLKGILLIYKYGYRCLLTSKFVEVIFVVCDFFLLQIFFLYENHSNFAHS